MFRRLFNQKPCDLEKSPIGFGGCQVAKRRLGKNDQHKFEEYFESIRDRTTNGEARGRGMP